MIHFEFQWAYRPAGSAGFILLEKADTIWDLINLMNKSEYPKPLVSKMRTELEQNDGFSYLLNQWHVFKIKKGSKDRYLKAASMSDAKN